MMIDGAQSVPHFEIDVQKLDCDFFCIFWSQNVRTNGSWYSLRKGRNFRKISAFFHGGGEMIATCSFEKTTYAALPLNSRREHQMLAEILQ